MKPAEFLSRLQAIGQQPPAFFFSFLERHAKELQLDDGRHLVDITDVCRFFHEVTELIGLEIENWMLLYSAQQVCMPLVAQNDDPELLEWLAKAKQDGGGFVSSIANAGLVADHDNYPIIRPVLIAMRRKYIAYEPSDAVKKEIRERSR